MKIIGNQKNLTQIHIAAKAAEQQNKSIPHIMLRGSAGCGKTTTARYLASITGANFMSVACDSLKTSSDVATLIKSLDRRGWSQDGRKVDKIYPTIVFIDEIHGLSGKAQEDLGILMEEFEIPIKLDDIRGSGGQKARRRWSPRFTLVGATTDEGRLTKPFRDRFKLQLTFTPYNYEEAREIIKLHANKLHIKITENAIHEIARRGRGIPRILVRYLERCYDMALALNCDEISEEIAVIQFGELGIDTNGLDLTDIKILLTLYEIGEPVGLDNLAVQLMQPAKVLSEASEPFLVQKGYIIRTSKGRKLTAKGKQYLVENGHIKNHTDNAPIDIPVDFDRGEI